MKLSSRTKSILWGFLAGAIFSTPWFISIVLNRGRPMLMPGQSRLDVYVSEACTGVLIFFGTAIPVALLVAFRGRLKD
jgi:hypothetical protein